MAPPAAAKPAAKGAASPQTFAAQPVALKVAILVFILAGLGGLYYAALHDPLSGEIASAQARHRTLEGEMREAEARQREFIQLREELASREGMNRQNMRVLPEEAEMASFLQDLNRLAETSGLSIRLVEPRPEEPDVHFVRLPVQLRVAGRYHQLARFFYNVSRLERAISMENIRLGEPRVVGEDVLLDVGMLATTYRRPTTAEAAAQSGPPARGGAGARPAGGRPAAGGRPPARAGG
jgi:type IV pilus assembly protein PilO